MYILFSRRHCYSRQKYPLMSIIGRTQSIDDFLQIEYPDNIYMSASILIPPLPRLASPLYLITQQPQLGQTH